MSIKSSIEEMPAEKQVAWALRLIITVAVMGAGTISWNAMQKLDRISETQAVQSTQLTRLIFDDTRRVSRMDELRDMYYLLRDRVAAVELRIDQQERRNVTPER